MEERDHFEPQSIPRANIHTPIPVPLCRTEVSQWVGASSPQSGPGDQASGGMKLLKGNKWIFFPNVLLPVGLWESCDCSHALGDAALRLGVLPFPKELREVSR